MSLEQAKDELAFMNAIDVLEKAGVDEATLHTFKSGHQAMFMINSAASMLMDRADPKAAENYVSLTMVGVRAPFDRMKVELVKAGKLSSTDKAEKYHVLLLALLGAIEDQSIEAAIPSHLQQIASMAAGVRIEVDAMQAPQREESLE